MAVNKNSGSMKAPVKFSPITLENVTVTYSHIQKPDLEYNTGHSVTVEVTESIMEMLKEITKQSGVSKVNGVSKADKDGKYKSCDVKDKPTQIKFKNGIYSNDGIERFPDVFDMDGQRTMENPYGGDVVNLVVRPKVWDMNGKESISVYLNEIQIVEKNSGAKVTFAKPQQKEATFDASQKPGVAASEDLPF
tara:strand:+ start:5830 stop:6405 length:576 start_codon:yes stop_codon:yes gene_type:complete